MATEYPDITDWNNLNKYADLFKTSESGDQGQFLGSDPTFVTNDQALIDNLDLNYKIVNSGSEAASIRRSSRRPSRRRRSSATSMTRSGSTARSSSCRSKLPEWTEGCDTDPKTVACDYPLYTLNKIVGTDFATNGGDAYTLIKNFTWTNADQNQVADYITNKGMSADEAGAKWVADNEAVWQAWMPLIPVRPAR